MLCYNVRLNSVIVTRIYATSQVEAEWLAIESYGMRATVELA